MGVVGPSLRHLRRMGMVNGQPAREADAPKNEEPTIQERVVTGENYNMNIKEMSLLAANGHYVYHNSFGVARLSLENAWLKDETGKAINTRPLYKKENDEFKPIDDLMNFISNEAWDSTPLFIRDPNARSNNPYGYYGNNNQLMPGQKKEIKITGISLRAVWNFLHDPNSLGSTQEAREELSFATKKELDSYMVLAFESFDSSRLKHPMVEDIKEGEKYYLIGAGTVTVTKVFDYPSRKQTICKVIRADGLDTEKEIAYHCNNLFFLPTLKWENPLKVLDENKNELALFPYVIREGKTFNVYWKPVAEAAEYIVSLYRIIEFDKRTALYHLKDYVVDRNETFLTVDGLIGNTFVFKVTAENRNGEVLAMSRGMENGVPKFFVREDE